MEKNKLKKYELKIDEENKGVFAISLVDEPAIESDFIFYSKEKEEQIIFAKDNGEMIVTGPVLIPEKEILRKNKMGEYYNVFMSKETVKENAVNFFKNYFNKNVTLQHEVELEKEKAVYFESWIVNDSNSDKSKVLGFKNVVDGTWFVSLKIFDENLWNEITKEGSNFKGFSIEGLYSKEEIKQSLIKKNNDMSLIDKLKALLFEAENEKTEVKQEEVKKEETKVVEEPKTEVKQAEVIEEFPIAEKKILIYDDNTVTYEDGSAVEDGEYQHSENPNMVLVVKSGKKEMVVDTSTFSIVKKLNDELNTVKAELSALKTSKEATDVELAKVKNELETTSFAKATKTIEASKVEKADFASNVVSFLQKNK